MRGRIVRSVLGEALGRMAFWCGTDQVKSIKSVMGISEQKIQELKQKGYDPIYIWDANPNEEDLEHTHLFDTRILILEGELEIRLDGKSIIMKTGDSMDIPREKIHYGKAGITGCKYIVAEKH